MPIRRRPTPVNLPGRPRLCESASLPSHRRPTRTPLAVLLPLTPIVMLWSYPGSDRPAQVTVTCTHLVRATNSSTGGRIVTSHHGALVALRICLVIRAFSPLSCLGLPTSSCRCSNQRAFQATSIRDKLPPSMAPRGIIQSSRSAKPCLAHAEILAV